MEMTAGLVGKVDQPRLLHDHLALIGGPRAPVRRSRIRGGTSDKNRLRGRTAATRERECHDGHEQEAWGLSAITLARGGTFHVASILTRPGLDGSVETSGRKNDSTAWLNRSR